MELFVFLLIGIPYLLLISALTVGFIRIKPINNSTENTPFITVLVPFKDEVLNLPLLIKDLTDQSYKNYEVLLIADHVASGWQERLQFITDDYPNINIISSPNKGKKGALTFGLTQAKGEIIAYTDADCRVTSYWLETINNYFDSKTNMVLGPVIMSPVDTIFERIQALEMQSLMASTAGSSALNHPIMCSGANLAVRKSVYSDLSDSYIKEKVSSGDDMFLMMSLQKQKKRSIKFMKNANGIVSTEPEKGLINFFRQRMRWTSKSTSYTSADVIVSAIIVLLTNSLAIFGFFINPQIAFVFLVGKIIIDFPIIYLSASMFKDSQNLSVYLLTELMYPFYVVLSAIGGLLFPLTWKGQKVKK